MTTLLRTLCAGLLVLLLPVLAFAQEEAIPQPMHPSAGRTAAPPVEGLLAPVVDVDDDFTPATPGWGVTKFATIQGGVNAVDIGGTVNVAAGSYTENVVIAKALSLLGPNAAINPNMGSRVPEAVVYSATSGPYDYTPLLFSVIFEIQAGNVTVKGFTLNGNTPTLTSGFLINGEDVDAASGIYCEYRVGDITVQNNILQTFSYAAIHFYNYTPDANATTNNYITDNKLDNMMPASWGIGILIYNNFYASITGNVLTRTRVGIQTGNFYQADPGTTHSISNNSIETSRLAIFFNLLYGSASTFDVNNNTITDVPGYSPTRGILFSSIGGSVGVNASGNNITGLTIGIEVWNCTTTSTVTITGGIISGCDYGIQIDNYDGYSSNGGTSAVNLSGVTIQNSVIAGLYIKDNPLNSNGASVSAAILAGTIFSGNPIDVLLDGIDVSYTTAVTGLSWWHMNTGSTNPIQAMIDAAAPGDILAIPAGTYGTGGATINVNKALTLQGVSQTGVIVNVSGNGASWGIHVSVSNVTMGNFTVTPASGVGSGYPIHVAPEPVVTPISTITLHHITIAGSYRSGISFHGVDNGTLSYITVTGATYGVGIGISGCTNVSLDHITTSGNAWGGVAVYVSTYLSRGSDNINLDKTTSSLGESAAYYLENGSGLYNTDVGGNGWAYRIWNYVDFPNVAAMVDNLTNGLLAISTLPHPQNGALEKTDGTGFFVTPPLKIQAAIDNSIAVFPTTITVDAGTYTESLNFTGKPDRTLIGNQGNPSLVVINTTGTGGYGSPLTGIFIPVSGVALKGLTVVGAGQTVSSNPRYGIKFSASFAGATVEDLVVHDFYRAGLEFHTGTGVSVTDVNLYNNGGTGMVVRNINGATFTNITTANNTWGGIRVQTDPLFPTDNIVFAGTNSFGENGQRNGGLYTEQDPPGYAPTYGYGPGVNIRILQADFEHALLGPQDDALPRVRFYKTLGQAAAAATGVPAPDHLVPAGAYIRNLTDGRLYVENLMFIQAAVNGANAVDTVIVGPGTYREQVYINKNLFLQASAGSNATFVVPPLALMAQPFLPARQERPIIGVDSLGTSVVVDGFTVDGEGAGNTHAYMSGIQYFKASGEIRNCTVKRVRRNPFGGAGWGVGILANHDNPRSYAHTVEIHHDSVYDCGKGNIIVNHPGSVGNVHHNVVIGQGPVGAGSDAQLGIQFGWEATGTIAYNEIRGFSYTGGTWSSSSILGIASGGVLDIHHNTVTDGQMAIDLEQYAGYPGASSADVYDNVITASSAGVGGVTYYGSYAWSLGSALTPPEGSRERPQASPYVTEAEEAAKTGGGPEAAMTVSYTGNSFTSNTPGSGIGIYLLSTGTSSLTATGDSNDIAAFEVGVVTDKDAGATLASTWRRNGFLGNNWGMYDLTASLQDAKENWWNDASGPRDVKTLPNTPNYNNPAGLGDSVSAFVDYNAWYLDQPMTQLSIYTMGVSTVGNGNVVVDPDQPTYLHGTPVNLYAVPDPLNSFVGWTGDTVTTEDTITVIMDGNKTYTAAFTYLVDVTVAGSGSVARTPDEPLGYAPGSFVGLKATPLYGYQFLAWSGDTVETADTLWVNVNGNKTYTATFGLGQFPVNVTVSGNGSVQKVPNQTQYDYLSTVTLTAVPGGSFSFLHWSGDTSTTANPIDVFVDGPKNIVAVFLGDKFLTVSPETMIIKAVTGKLMRPARRRSGQTPNWVNLIEETVVQGGFQPGATESDAAGGMVVGLSFVEPSGLGRWKPIRDSALTHGWARLSRWRTTRNEGYNYRAIPKSLEDQTGMHDGTPRGLDIYTFNTIPQLRVLKGEFHTLPPRRHDNPLFAEMVALKLNIAASQLGKTPVGLGELAYYQPGHILHGLMLTQISRAVDSIMTYWRGVTFETYDSLYTALHRINRAFVGPLDTVSWFAGGTLVLNGTVRVSDVPFFTAPPVPPVMLVRTTDETESSEEFDEEEFQDGNGVPVAAKLLQNYPNPFNPSTTIMFKLREPSMVTVTIFDMVGREVAALVSGEELQEGEQMVEFTAAGLASGVYFYRVDAQGLETADLRTVETRKMLLLK
ncbi:MAG: T9SS type A sorting domain-containing protein [Bacteroidota bacterium]